jgi:hypothetical protein
MASDIFCLLFGFKLYIWRECTKQVRFVYGVNTPYRPQDKNGILSQMNAERDIGGESNKREHEFYNSIIMGLLAFMVTFVLLRWILF